MSCFKTCPRCNEKSYEVLKTHSHCFACNYNPDELDRRNAGPDDLPIPRWAEEALKENPRPRRKSATKSCHQEDPLEGGAA